ncbi:MAG TPA: CGNR zinc finger domain-containing protein [Jiangellaceae bacterium]
MNRAAELAGELVNLAAGGAARGHDYEPPRGEALAEQFSRILTAHWAGEVLGTHDAPNRIEQMAQEFRTVFQANGDAGTADALNRLLRRYGTRPYLAVAPDQQAHVHFHGDAETPVESLGGEFAAGLALVVDAYGHSRLGVCTAHHCDRVYVDLTRNGSRRYCSNACGARAKMAAYRSRLSAGDLGQ